MEETWRHYAKKDKPVQKGHILYDLPFTNLQTESRKVATRGWQKKEMGY